MWVSVTLARRTVGRPAGVGNTQAAGQGFTGQGLFQLADFTGRRMRSRVPLLVKTATPALS
jgi:hypothetical protein